MPDSILGNSLDSYLTKKMFAKSRNHFAKQLQWPLVKKCHHSRHNVLLNNIMSHYDFYTTSVTKDDSHFYGYKFISKLGEGVFATVFLADYYEGRNPKEPVKKLACKVIDTLKAPKDYVSKFLPRELEVLRRVNHPHIIQAYAVYKKNTKFLIFMRHAENGNLLNILKKKGPVSESQARIWVRQLALAIQYIHELEIAHRDLKCDNVLVTANFNVKLADFSFSSPLLNKHGIRMLSETYCGSSSYSAPEILRGIPYNPKPSDVWSLGVIIYVMINKALPFEDATLKKIYEQQIARKWKLKPFAAAIVSNQMKELLNCMLEPNVELRYTIAEVLNSEWIFMDHRLLGLTEEETLALVNAREERRKMEEGLKSAKKSVVTERTRSKTNDSATFQKPGVTERTRSKSNNLKTGNV